MQIKGIIVDVGGVLVQTVNTNSYRIWEEKLHLKPGQLYSEIYSLDWGSRATIGEISSNYVWQEIKKKFNLSMQDIEDLESDFYSADILNLEFYNYLKNLGTKYKIVILSDAWDNARSRYTQKYNLEKVAGKIILSAEEGLRKPDERFMQLALDYLGTTTQETLYIDDTVSFITQAKLLGIKTVLFTNTTSAIAEIESLF